MRHFIGLFSSAIGRVLQLNSRWTRFLSVSVPFMTRVVKDYTAGNILKNEGELARDLRIVIEKLGPTFIKVQAVQFMSVLIAILYGYLPLV